ncbi:MAG: ribonuclease P protein component [Bacilli bacterium]|nr:ribonuclease P protein component [Bacilli bacterium]
MKRENRIRKNTDFKEIISKHHMIKSDEFTIYSNKNDLDHTRIGISVSSKIGNAVIRNKIKRQIKAMIKDLMKLDKNVDIVIIVREGYKNNTFDQNFDSLKKLLKGLQ